MNSPKNLFRGYKPLSENCIRVLHLLPGDGLINDIDGIRCTFRPVRLDDRPPFEALSYVWGDASVTETVLLEDQEVQITRNLHTALCHLRPRPGGEPRVLWVDAMCINQADTDERTQQVSMMGLIYSRAARVVVFLDSAWPGSDLAMDFMELMAREPGRHYDPALEPHIVVPVRGGEGEGLDIESPELREALMAFFSLPWWTRLWVVQEYALGQDVVMQCGDRTMPAGNMEAAFAATKAHSGGCCSQSQGFGARFPRPPGGPPDAVSRVVDGFIRIEPLLMMRDDGDSGASRAKSSMLHALAIFRMRRCYDPLDRLYSLAGLNLQHEVGRIKPVYQIDPEKIYEVFAHCHIKCTGSLDVISHAHHQVEGGLKGHVPSWVPDWSARVTLGAYKDHLDRGAARGLYAASCGAPAEVISHHDGVIGLKGRIVDRISRLAPALVPEKDGPNKGQTSLVGWKEIFRNYLDEASPDNTALVGPQARHPVPRVVNAPGKEDDKGNAEQEEQRELVAWGPSDAFLLTLCGSVKRSGTHYTVVPIEPFGESLASFRRYQQAREQTPETSEFNESVRFNGTGRTFAITEGGCLGMVPAVAKVGDSIAVLLGGNVPFVLREHPLSDLGSAYGKRQNPASMPDGSGIEGTRRRYRVIGDAYIHGIMQGECLASGDGQETHMEPILLA